MLAAQKGAGMHNEKFAAIEATVDQATEDMTEEQLRFHPQGKWSTAEILEHLALTYGGTARVFEKRLAEGPQGGSPTPKQMMGHLLVLEMGVFPFKRKSPEPVAPQGKMGGGEALALLKQNLTKMDDAFAAYAAKHRDGSRVANHPVLGPLTLQQWPKFHLNHCRHHMEQIGELRASQGLRRGI
jgi:hypothetical protein